MVATRRDGDKRSMGKSGSTQAGSGRWRMSQDQSMDAVNTVSAISEPARSNVDADHGTLLYMEGVNVSFDGFKAINDLNFYVNCLLYTSPSPRDRG